MPGNLEWKPRDPNFRRGPADKRVETDRGAGWYWHRGNGRYSQYTGKVDRQVKHPTKKIRDPARKRIAQLERPHKNDYGSKRQTLVQRYKGHPTPKAGKGKF